MKTLVHTEDYAALRRREYPPLEDFADAMYWLDQGDETKIRKYLAAVASVKKKYPKESNT